MKHVKDVNKLVMGTLHTAMITYIDALIAHLPALIFSPEHYK